ncbi:MAG: hypothetical protein JKY22_12300 [Flavobacteriaceae bacterium]|nr:hypothetical protein [Flavobacteriaceae bacterium]
MLALIVIDGVMKANGGEAVITSLNDARHSQTSLHYAGAGVDLRSWIFNNQGDVLEQCKKALGNSPDFDLILESDHYHLEYQPKRR